MTTVSSCCPWESARTALSHRPGSQPHDASALVAAARQSGLTAYDAAYFELALRRNLPLGNARRQMRAAARKAGVELLL